MKLKYYGLMSLSGVFLGTSYIFNALLRDKGVSTLEQMVFGMIFITIIVFTISYAKKLTKISKRHLKPFLIIGSTMALGSFFLIGAVSIGTPVAITVLLFYTFPIYTAIFSKRFLDEDVGLRSVLSILLGIFGVAVILEVWNIGEIRTLLGPAMALLGGLLFTPEFIGGRFVGKEKYHYITSSLWTYIFRLVITFLMFPLVILIPNKAISSFSVSFTPYIWLLLLGYAVLPFVIGRFMEFAALREIRAVPASIFFLTEPVATPILAFFILGEAITYTIAIGGAFIILACALVLSERG